MALLSNTNPHTFITLQGRRPCVPDRHMKCGRSLTFVELADLWLVKIARKRVVYPSYHSKSVIAHLDKSSGEINISKIFRFSRINLFWKMFWPREVFPLKWCDFICWFNSEKSLKISIAVEVSFEIQLKCIETLAHNSWTMHELCRTQIDYEPTQSLLELLRRHRIYATIKALVPAPTPSVLGANAKLFGFQ